MPATIEVISGLRVQKPEELKGCIVFMNSSVLYLKEVGAPEECALDIGGARNKFLHNLAIFKRDDVRKISEFAPASEPKKKEK